MDPATKKILDDHFEQLKHLSTEAKLALVKMLCASLDTGEANDDEDLMERPRGKIN